MKKALYRKGFTLAELVISSAILALIAYPISLFMRDIFTLNFTAQNNLSAQLDARHVIKIMVSELRSASPSSLGAYSILSAATSTITFYDDINNDGTKEQLRYFLANGSLKRGVIVPTGSPLVYVAANETITSLVSNVINGTSTPVFTYYDSTYTGTSSPLTYPLSVANIRLVRITVIIDKDPNKSPSPITVTSAVMIRNLKDNY